MRRSLFLLIAALVASAPGAPAASTGLPDLSGSWAQLQVTTSETEIPVLGTFSSTSRSLLLLTIEQEGRALRVRETICSVDVGSRDDSVRVVIPSKLQSALSGAQRRAELLGDPARGSIRFKQAPRMVVLGAELARKNDALPEEPTDPRVRDTDADGKPGITVRLEGRIDGEIYLTQRSWNRLEGEASADRIDGTLIWNSEQKVLDATSVLLRSSPDARPSLDPARNYFRTRRLTPEDASCRAVRAKSAELFGRSLSRTR